MRLRNWLLRSAFSLAIGFGLIGHARAHFLFIRVGPMAESGRSAEVFFSEQAEAGDPKFVEKIAGTELWLQTRANTFTPLTVRKANDRLRASVPPGGSLSVVGVCEYGVLARPKQPAFLLRYFPKAVAGKVEEVNAFASFQAEPKTKPVRLEIMPTFAEKGVKLVALREGKAVPGLVFTTVASDLTNTEVTADKDGNAFWTPSAPGRYSVYVKDVLKTPGEHEGKSYDEIRDFATLAFTWPLDRRDADAEAVATFEKALANRAPWNDFTGFSAEITGTLDGRAFAGKVSIASDGIVKAQVDDAAARPWIEDQLGSIAMHRISENDRGPSADRSKPILRFADDDEDNPLGRLLTFHGGRFASSYRVKDDQINVVNRHIGKQTMTITVLDNTRNAEGKSLPHSYLVHYWDALSGDLQRVETIQERWKRVDKLDLPTRHTVTTASDTGLSVKSLELSNHILAPAK